MSSCLPVTQSLVHSWQSSLCISQQKSLQGGTEQDVLCGCRYGYSNVQQLTRVVQSYEYFKIPLETFVTDSQYMDHDQDFTISPDFEPWGVRISIAPKTRCMLCLLCLLAVEQACTQFLHQAEIPCRPQRAKSNAIDDSGIECTHA